MTHSSVYILSFACAGAHSIEQEFRVLGHHMSCFEHLFLVLSLQERVVVLLSILHGLDQIVEVRAEHLLSHVHLQGGRGGEGRGGEGRGGEGRGGEGRQ